MKSLLLFTVATSFLNAISCAVGKTPLMLEKDNVLCQSKELNYWNAIILHDFKAIGSQDASPSGIDGSLIIGSDLAIDNYYINSKGNIQCQSQYNESIPLTEYGLYMAPTHQRYQIKDAIISGSIQLHGENEAESNAQASFHDNMVRPMQSCRLMVNSSPPPQHEQEENAPSMATYERIAKKTSLYLSLQKPTHTLSKDGQIKSVSQPHDNNDKYYYFNFASCPQNNAAAVCDINTKTTYLLSDPAVFSQAIDTNVVWPTDKPIVFNIPVLRDSTFKLDIPQALTNQLPACNTVWNFFTVDKQGIMDESAEQSFTVHRISDTKIGGTFLLPFGNVVDGSSGGFAGQLIASNYESKGASLYDFEAIDASCHIAAAAASCWPHLTRDDATQTDEPEEPEDDLEWMVRRGRQLLPVAVEEEEHDQSASMVDEISKALASTTTVTEIVFPSEAVSESSVSSILSEYSSLLDELNPQQFQDMIDNPENEQDMAAFENAYPGQQAGHPLVERPPADLNPWQRGRKTTVTLYTGTRTMTHHVHKKTSITIPFSRVKTMASTTTMTSITGTETFTVQMPHEVEAHPTGVSFDLMNDRVLTLY